MQCVSDAFVKLRFVLVLRELERAENAYTVVPMRARKQRASFKKKYRALDQTLFRSFPIHS